MNEDSAAKSPRWGRWGAAFGPQQEISTGPVFHEKSFAQVLEKSLRGPAGGSSHPGAESGEGLERHDPLVGSVGKREKEL